MFRSQPPRRTSDLPYWNFLKLEKKDTFKGWLAGPIVGVIVHHIGESKPCRKALTGGKLKCYGCDTQVKKVWRGYVPLWDEFGQRMVSLIGFNYAALADTIKLHQAVKVTKTTLHGSPIRVEPFAWASPRVPLSEADARPQDLRPWLLRLWKDSTLAKWLTDNPEPTPATAHVPKIILPDEQFTDRVQSIKEMLHVRGIPVKPEAGPSPIGDVLDHVLKNGKHGKK